MLCFEVVATSPMELRQHTIKPAYQSPLEIKSIYLRVMF